MSPVGNKSKLNTTSGSYAPGVVVDPAASCCRETGPQMLVAPEPSDDQDQLVTRAFAASVGL